MAPYGLGKEKTEEITDFLKSRKYIHIGLLTSLLVMAGTLWVSTDFLQLSIKFFPTYIEEFQAIRLSLLQTYLCTVITFLVALLIMLSLLLVKRFVLYVTTKMCSPFYFFLGFCLGAFGGLLLIFSYFLHKHG